MRLPLRTSPLRIRMQNSESSGFVGSLVGNVTAASVDKSICSGSANISDCHVSDLPSERINVPLRLSPLLQFKVPSPPITPEAIPPHTSKVVRITSRTFDFRQSVMSRA